MWTAVIQLLLFTLYIGHVIRKYGIQGSLSDTYYVLEQKWAFSVILCFSIGLLHLTHGTILFFLSGALLCFVGTASDYRRARTTRAVHYIGALGAISLSLIELCRHGIWWPVEACIVLIMPISFLENRYWWLEITAFY